MEKKNMGGYFQRLWFTRSSTVGTPPLRCPNDCGYLTLLKRRQSMLHLVPEDLLEHLEGKELAEGEYGYLAGVCPECGFVLVVDEAILPVEYSTPRETVLSYQAKREEHRARTSKILREASG